MHLLLGPFAQAAIGKAADRVVGLVPGTSRTDQKLVHDSMKQALNTLANLVETDLRESGMTDGGIKQLQSGFCDFIVCKPVCSELARCFTEMSPDLVPDHTLLAREWKARGLPDLPAPQSWRDVAKKFTVEALTRRTCPVLVTWQEFYAGEIERHATTEFQASRTEKGRTTRPLDAVSEFINGTKPILVIDGSGGMGKSRLLVAAAERHAVIRFVQTRRLGSDMPELAESIKTQAKPGDVIVLDDCHEYRLSVERLLGAALIAKARVIMAVRYREWIEPALRSCNLSPEELTLGPVGDAAVIVPTGNGTAESINKIARGNLALAVMAYGYWQRHRDLTGIEDRFDLFSRIVDDITKTGNDLGDSDVPDFLAELAIRNGLRDSAKSFQRHKTFVIKVKAMGYVTIEPRGERAFYRIYPDRLRDYVIQTTYERSGILHPTFDALLERLPPDETTDVIAMLAIQQKETRDETWKKAACARLLDAMAKRFDSKNTGYTHHPGKRDRELMMEIGVAAYEAFGEYAFVAEHLGDFCIGAEKLNSVVHLDMAGKVSMQTGQPERSRACYERALLFAQSIGNKALQAACLRQLGRLAQAQGDYSKARSLGYQSLAIAQELGDKSDIARILHQLTALIRNQGDYAEARKLYDQSLAIALELGDKPGIARSFHQLATVARNQSDYAEARKLSNQSLAVDRELGNASGMAISYHQLALLAQEQGNYAEAHKLYDESLAMAQELGNKSGIARILHQWATLAQNQGDYAEARRLCDQSLAINRELGNKSGMAISYHQLAVLAQDQSDYAEAHKLHGQSLAIKQELDDKPGMAVTYHQLAVLAQDQHDYAEAHNLHRQSLAIKQKLGDRFGLAISLNQLGRLAEAEKDDRTALESYLKALSIFEELRSPYRDLAKQDLARMQQRLGDEAFKKVHDQVVAELSKEQTDDARLPTADS